MQAPKIAIVVSSFNREHLIAETIDSIIAQTYTNWECIIIDDRSKDNVAKAVEPYVEKDSRISFYVKLSDYEPGLSETRNYGLDLAKKINPDFIQFFDDDDIMHPRKLELQLESLLQNPGASFSICGALNFKDTSEIKFDEVKEVWPKTHLSIGEAFLTWQRRFVAQVPLFRCDYAKKFRFDEDLFYGEEWTLFTQQFLLTNPKFSVVNQVLFYRRKHADSMTEGKDPGMKKRKSQAVVHLKVFEFLNKENAHTRTTLLFFTKDFLLNSFDKDRLKIIREKLKAGHSYVDYVRFQLAYQIIKITRKIIGQILKH